MCVAVLCCGVARYGVLCSAMSGRDVRSCGFGVLWYGAVRYGELSLTHSPTPLLVRFTQIWG